MKALRQLALVLIFVTWIAAPGCHGSDDSKIHCIGVVSKYLPGYQRSQVADGQHTWEEVVDLVEISIDLPSQYKGTVLKLRHNVKMQPLGRILAESLKKRISFDIRAKLLNEPGDPTDLPMTYELSDVRSAGTEQKPAK